MAYQTAPSRMPIMFGSNNHTTDLSLIDAITIERVVRRSGHEQFVVSVYLYHQPKKMPLPLISPTELFFRTRQSRHLYSSSDSYSSDQGEPDFEIQRRYSEFVELRHALNSIASDAHPKIETKHNLCPFCGPLLEFLNHDRKRPSKGLRMFESSKTQMEFLASFVRCLVGMVVNAKMEARQFQQPQYQPQHHYHHQQQGNCCVAVQQVEMVLENFLQKPKQPPSLGII